MKIETLLQHTGMWRAANIDPGDRKGTPTGFAVLDRHLAGGGWPADGIAELIHERPGIGELRLLVPALATLSHSQTRWLLWVDPPWIPYAPALARAGIDLEQVLVVQPKTRMDVLWVLEKALASGSCSAVLAWPKNIRGKEIRRLQVAGREGRSLGFLFRDAGAMGEASPAELRLLLQGARQGFAVQSSLQLRILKRRGGWATDTINIEFADNLDRAMPDFSEMQVRPHWRREKSLAVIDNPVQESFTRELERYE